MTERLSQEARCSETGSVWLEACGQQNAEEDALVSAQLNFREIDKALEDVLHRILWRAQKGSQIPYPEWAIGVEIDDDDE
jgi:hypothetical protein